MIDYEREACGVMTLYRILVCKQTNVGELTTDERAVKLSLSVAIRARAYMLEQLFLRAGDDIRDSNGANAAADQPDAESA